MSSKADIFTEEAVELLVNGERVVTFMCTPQDLKDIALGYLYSTGILETPEWFVDAVPCSTKRRVFSLVDHPLSKGRYRVKDVILSGCGSGEIIREDEVRTRERIPYGTEMKDIKESYRSMLINSPLHRTTGGTHSAAIYTGEGDIIVREDIGRHNAVDKVIGAALLKGADLRRCHVVITGRISSDMVMKAAGAGIPLIASMRITSNMAVELATRYGVTLVGRVGAEDPIIYNNIEGTEII